MIQERHDRIVKLVNARGIVKVPELMKEFGVSIETTRRDLEILEQQGFLKRVYGGAIRNTPKGVEPAYSSREVLHLAEKNAIAATVLDFVNDRDTIAIDLGTTTLEVAKALSVKQELTILTNAFPVAMELIKNPSNRVFLVGGQLRPGDYATSGFLAIEFLRHFRVDKALIGAGGVSLKNGITDYHVDEAYVRKEMINVAEQVICVADYSKFESSAFTKVCELSEIDILITDWRIPAKAVQQFKEAPVQLVVAPKPG